MTIDTPEALMSNTAFMGALHSGDASATSRWNAAHQAMYPEDGVHGPASGQTSPSPAAPRSPSDAATAQTQIQSMMADKAFMQRLAQGDPAASDRWMTAHQVAYEDADGQPGSGAPPDGSWYTLPPAPPGAEPAPELEASFRSAAHAFGLDFGAATELTAAFYQVSEMTQRMSDEDVADMMRDGIAQLRREPGVLDRARRVYAKLQRTHPAVAAAIEVSGAGANANFVRLLARHVRA